jgi:uncharacterized protein (TIGR02996 family)
MRTFTRRRGEQHLFRTIELKDGFVSLTEGEVGTEGKRKTRAFADLAWAEEEHARLIAQTIAEGYREEAGGPASPSAMQEALEQALVADPDDLVAHMAYADFLGEQPDPASVARSEYIRIQLTLDDRSVPDYAPAKQMALNFRPLEVHLRRWLGELAPFLLDDEQAGPKGQYSFHRGWLDSLKAIDFDCAFAKVLAHAPAARLLRHLSLVSPKHESPPPELVPPIWTPDLSECPAPWWFVQAPSLTNLRGLTLGSESSGALATAGDCAVALVRSLPRLERLSLTVHDVDMNALFGLPLHHLRHLHFACISRWSLQSLIANPTLTRLEGLVIDTRGREDRSAPPAAPPGRIISLDVLRGLARSPQFANLRRLTLQRTHLGDEGVREIIDSGLLGRLQYLSLRNGLVTDAGARALAARPELAHLDHLDLGYNCLTSVGIEALAATGARVSTKHQWEPTGNPYADDDTMHEGDLE